MASDVEGGYAFVVLLRDAGEAESLAHYLEGASTHPGDSPCVFVAPPIRGLAFFADPASQERLDRWWGAEVPADAELAYLVMHEEGLPGCLAGIDGRIYIGVEDAAEAELYRGLATVRTIRAEGSLDLAEAVLRDYSGPFAPALFSEEEAHRIAAFGMDREPEGAVGGQPEIAVGGQPEIAVGGQPEIANLASKRQEGMGAAPTRELPAAPGADQAGAGGASSLLVGAGGPSPQPGGGLPSPPPPEAAAAPPPPPAPHPFDLLMNAAPAQVTRAGPEPPIAAPAPPPSPPASGPPGPPAPVANGSDETGSRRSIIPFLRRRRDSPEARRELAIATVNRGPTVVVVGSRKGGVGKTSHAAGVAIVAGDTLDVFGHRAAIVDANIANPDTWGHLNLPPEAATVRDVVAALASNQEPPPPVHAASPALACYPESREATEYSRTDITLLAAYLRSRYTFIVVDMSNRLPDPFAGPEAAVAAHWMQHADVLVLPTGSSKEDFNGVLDFLDLRERPPTVVPYIEPSVRRNRDHPMTRQYLDTIRRRVQRIVPIPDDADTVRYAGMEGVPVEQVSPQLRTAYRELMEAIVRVPPRVAV